MRVPVNSAVKVTYADRCAVINAMRDVLLDNLLLREMAPSAQIPKGRWLSRPASQRKRFIDQGYVVVRPQAVYLAGNGFNILHYRETHDAC